MPAFIIAIMQSQHCLNISIDMPAIGFISQAMPVSVMVQHICAIIIGLIIGIMPFIIGMGIGIMLFIIGIMAGIAVIVVLLGLCRALLARLLSEGVSRFPGADNAVSTGACTFLRFGGGAAGMAGEFGSVSGNMSA